MTTYTEVLVMLVLARQLGEGIKIGDIVEIVVVDICHDKVRLGFNAPREVSIHRTEVYNAIKQEQKDA